MNLMMLLEMASSGFGDRVAVTNAGRSLSYGDLIRYMMGDRLVIAGLDA